MEDEHMKKKQLFIIVLVFIALVLSACGGAPKLGPPTQVQRAINDLPAVPLAGNNVKFSFGGDNWIATRNSVNFMGGTFSSEESNEGTVLTLKQTHLWSTQQKPGIGGDVGWVKTPGPEIKLLYSTAGGRGTLSVM